MTPQPSFTVAGKRVVVVGAARSGVAAALLLARRGASVVLTDVKERIDAEQDLRSAHAAGDCRRQIGGRSRHR